MGECIKREAAIAIIEEKQKELCPVGRYGREYVYGSDREKYDAWDEIIDALENIPAASPAQHQRRGKWGCYEPFSDGYRCSSCKLINRNSMAYCPNCGAKMDGGVSDAAD